MPHFAKFRPHSEGRSGRVQGLITQFTLMLEAYLQKSKCGGGAMSNVVPLVTRTFSVSWSVTFCFLLTHLLDGIVITIF